MVGIPLSNDSQDVIERNVVTSEPTKEAQLDALYEIQETACNIAQNSYKRVALQFPDEMLADAARITRKLQSLTSATFYILGDTSYGSCCVDEVAAEHVNADAVVHFGRSCLSPTSRLPIIYVFGRKPISLTALVESWKEQVSTKGGPLLLVCDVAYMHAQDDLLHTFRELGYQSAIGTTLKGTKETNESTEDRIGNTLPGRSYSLPENTLLSETTLLYVGPPSPSLTTTLMTHHAKVMSMYSFDPQTHTMKQESTASIALRRRYGMVQRSRDAGVIGIVVGTLGVSRYLELIQHLRKLISTAGKKSYVFAMGKLNPSKMANFAEIDIFVLVACGENSLIESRDFFKPVVTPYELTLALKAPPGHAVSWTGNWDTDFARVLRVCDTQDVATDNIGEDIDDDAPHFSLVTGKYVSDSRPMLAPPKQEIESSGNSVAIRSTETSLAMVGGFYSPAAHYLRQRKIWAGLGQDQSDEAEETNDIAKLDNVEEGRSGIARGYVNEKPL